MSAGTTDPDPAWNDALLAASVLAVDAAGVGGIVVKARAGAVRDRWLELLRNRMPPGMTLRRVPGHVDDERLLGGLELAATLRRGAPVVYDGLLVQADGGLLQIGVAERLSPAAAAHIAAAMDMRCVQLERDGITARTPTRFGVVAFDEGIEPDERVAEVLRERLALYVELEAVPFAATRMPAPDPERISTARTLLPKVEIDEERLGAICEVAWALGVGSLRAAWLATHVARVCAALEGRLQVVDEDIAAAVRLVLAARATRLPAPDSGDTDPEEAATDSPATGETPQDAGGDTDAAQSRSLEDVVLEAAKAAIPPGLLAELRASPASRIASRTAGRKGAQVQSRQRGRPAGTRAGKLRRGTRLNIVATLRAAAPWQAVRRAGRHDDRARIEVRSEDFRITRFKQRSQTTTVFVVDASGSAALNRLGEAKGAVELLLADCYVRRDRVALIAFRGKQGELLLAPTRSLARAKRCLAALPGGGGTPLASGLDVARTLTEATLRQGDSVSVVLLTDGRANITRDGRPDRAAAEQESLQAARALGNTSARTVVIDTSPRPQLQAERLAVELSARYVPLPNARADTLARAIQVAGGSRR